MTLITGSNLLERHCSKLFALSFTLNKRLQLAVADTASTVLVVPGVHNEKERTTLNTAHEPTFNQKSTYRYDQIW